MVITIHKILWPSQNLLKHQNEVRKQKFKLNITLIQLSEMHGTGRIKTLEIANKFLKMLANKT